MSHFTVLVIGDNPEQQLAPYQENNMGDCPKRYLQFFDQTEELLAGWESEKQEYPDFDKYATEYCGYQKDSESGKYGYWENPNAKWDWYLLGGRWTGFFMVKENAAVCTVGEPGLQTKVAPPGKADQCLAKDVDWEAMKLALTLEAQNDWEKFESWLRSESPKNKNPYFDFGVKCKKDGLETREEFMTRRSSPATFAVLKDGVWCEAGAMGWWGQVSDQKDPSVWHKQFSMIIESLNGDELLSLYDCHI